MPSMESITIKVSAVLVLCCVIFGANHVAARKLAQAPAPSQLSTCEGMSLTPELTEGPYYVDDIIFRTDIVEDQAGLPMTLRVAVVDADCLPLVDVFVDVWHANALGVYSGFTGETNDNTTFLRGVTLTDEEGMAEIETVFPGWYTGRTTHLHIKVHVPDNTSQLAEQQEFEDSHTAHTGQIFFTDDWTRTVFTSYEPYTSRSGAWMTNAEDSIYSSGGASTIVSVSMAEDGLLGTVTIKVEETSTPSAVGAGDGMGMGMGPGMGPMGGMPGARGPMPPSGISGTGTLG